MHTQVHAVCAVLHFSNGLPNPAPTALVNISLRLMNPFGCSGSLREATISHNINFSLIYTFVVAVAVACLYVSCLHVLRDLTSMQQSREATLAKETCAQTLMTRGQVSEALSFFKVRQMYHTQRAAWRKFSRGWHDKICTHRRGGVCAVTPLLRSLVDLGGRTLHT